MDYKNLTKEEIIKILEEKKLSYSSSFTKDKLIEILIDDDNESKNIEKIKHQLSFGNENTAANWNIAFGIIWIIIGVLTLIFLIGIVFIIYGVKTYKWNSDYKKDPNEINTWKAGIYGLWWSVFPAGAIIFRTNDRLGQEARDLVSLSWVLFWISLASCIIFAFILPLTSIIIGFVLAIILLVKAYKFKKPLYKKFQENENNANLEI